MGEVTPIPQAGAVLFDPRDDGRSLRLSWHADTGMFVVSLWRHDDCVGTFHLAGSEVPGLIHALALGLAAQAALGDGARRSAVG